MEHCARRDQGYVPFMDWQQVVSLGIVAAAAFLLLRGRLRRNRLKLGAGSHCGCEAASSAGYQNSIVFRARKGQRPEVRIRM
jgi:hypothetical protein